MMTNENELNGHIDRLHANGIVDRRFDLLLDLYEKRDRTNALQTDYQPDLQAGNIGVLAAAILEK